MFTETIFKGIQPIRAQFNRDSTELLSNTMKLSLKLKNYFCNG